MSDSLAAHIFAAGQAYGVTKEIILGLKKPSFLLARYQYALLRVQSTENTALWGFDPVEGIEDDWVAIVLYGSQLL